LRGERHRRGGEQRADGFAAGKAHQHLGLAPRGNDRVRAAARGALRGEDLGQHAALGELAADAAGECFECSVASLGFLDEFRG